MKTRNHRGFTFIEIMLVVVIIGVLASLIVPRLVGKSKEAKISAAKAEIEALSTGLDLYETHNGKFPTTEQGLEALLRKPATPPIPGNWQGPYLKKPKLTDPWENAYHYTSPGIHNQDYDLQSYGPDGVEGGGDDVKNWQ